MTGLSFRDALIAGLLREKPSGGYYDYFRGRIMIPIRGLNGELVAFGGRALGTAVSQGPELSGFHCLQEKEFAVRT